MHGYLTHKERQARASMKSGRMCKESNCMPWESRLFQKELLCSRLTTMYIKSMRHRQWRSVGMWKRAWRNFWLIWSDYEKGRNLYKSFAQNHCVHVCCSLQEIFRAINVQSLTCLQIFFNTKNPQWFNLRSARLIGVFLVEIREEFVRVSQILTLWYACRKVRNMLCTYH